MSRLVELIDDYRDTHGQPSMASIARAIGVAPQTISSWQNRGVKELPNRDTLRRLAAYINADLEVVIDAALVDAKYKPPGARPRRVSVGFEESHRREA